MSNSTPFPPMRRVAAAIATSVAALVAFACADATSPAPDAVVRANGNAASNRAIPNAKAAENRDLATLRNALARYHNFEYASGEGGYAVIFDNKCFEQSGVGAMGLHYVNVSRVTDGNTVELEHPEALMFEPGPAGSMQLVGVEYVVDSATWADAHPNGELPRLFNRDFVLNSVYKLYTLHVWTHKNNPAGTFEGWNPMVSCKYWNAEKAARHH